MAGKHFSGTYTSTIDLTNPATENPATITATGRVTAASGDGVYGAVGFAWTVTSFGTIDGLALDGVFLAAGGKVTNGSSNSSKALIEGARNGVLVFGATGTVANFGTIEGTGTASVGVYLGAGGGVTNGSLGSTSALVEGALVGVMIRNKPGSVSNFGTINSTKSTAVVLTDGGSVANGSTKSTTAMISGGTPSNAIYIGGGAGRVTNFGTIKSGLVAVGLADGGSVVNGSRVSTKALIDGVQSVQFTKGPGTVINFGTMAGGVDLYVGGSVTNGSANSTLASVTGGVDVRGDAGRITNFGTIESGGTGQGVDLTAGGSVVNRGLISSSGNAVFISGTAGSVANFGTIKNFGMNSAVYLQSGGDVTNGLSSSTQALIQGGTDGVHIAGAVGIVSNFGTIEGESANSAIYLASGGSVTNGSSVSKAALLKGGTLGVHILGAGTVRNFGTVQGGGADSGVYLASGGDVTNESSASRIAGGTFGVHIATAGGTVTNFGTVDGGSLGGVDLAAGGAIMNHGLIEGGTGGIDLGTATSAAKIVNFGTISGAVGLSVAAGDTASTTLRNAGTIAGTGGIAVALGAGNDLLTVDTGAVFVGAVNGGGGTNKLIEGAAGVLDVRGFSGFETIVLV